MGHDCLGMLHRLAAGIAAAALTLLLTSIGGPSIPPDPTTAVSCLPSTVTSAWARLAARVPTAAACTLTAVHTRRHIPAVLLAQFPHTAVELNGRVYLDMVLHASPPPPGTP